MPTEPPTLLVIANSGRAIAQSAVRGGYLVRVIDAFADQDTRDCADCLQVPMQGAGLDLDCLTAALERMLAVESVSALQGVIYGAGLEGAPPLLSWMSERLPVLGNHADTLALVTDTGRFFSLLDELRIPYPETRLDPPVVAQEQTWLLKETVSSGGQGVTVWDNACRRPARAHYFQRHLDGVPMSLLFIANGNDLAVIGYNRLLLSGTGGDRPFLYGGALGRALLSETPCQSVERYARSLVAALGLRGINSLDFVLKDGRAYLLELNPRPSATMALYEDDCPEGWIRRHVRSCGGELPDVPTSPRPGVVGQKILYAWRDISIPRGLDWPDWCHDRPAEGSWLACGAPLCSLSAEGPHAAWVEAELADRSRRIVALFSSIARPATLNEEAL
jgi:uncharacterized protein